VLARGRRPTLFGSLDSPEGLVVAHLTARRLAGRLGVDAPAAQLLREGLAPALQIGLAGVEPLAVPRLGANAEVDVRVGLVVVQDHHVAMVAELGAGELPGGALHDQRVGAARHRQHDVERLAPVGRLVDERAAMAPLLDQVLQRLLAFPGDAAVILELEAAALGDVAEVRGDRRHAPAATVTLTITCGERRRTVASMRRRIAAARPPTPPDRRGVGSDRTIRLRG
jgi:hypothetical protein